MTCLGEGHRWHHQLGAGNSRQQLVLVVWIVHWHWSVLGLGAVGDSEAALPGGRLQHATSVGGHFDQWKWNVVILLSGYGIYIRLYWKGVIAQYQGWTVVFQICTLYTAFLDKEIFHQSPGRRLR